jgi:hypothetical protein
MNLASFVASRKHPAPETPRSILGGARRQLSRVCAWAAEFENKTDTDLVQLTAVMVPDSVIRGCGV